MKSVFLSYAREDVDVALRFEATLTKKGYSVWRDQEQIRGGELWPKVTGEAMAACDFFLLLWSDHSRSSHFVEFEWTTAFALKKPIIPCLLQDDLELPEALVASNAIFAADFKAASGEILRALEQPTGEADLKHQATVVAKLAEMEEHEPAAVAACARALFEQQGWLVHGDVYQAGRDIHIHKPQPPARKGFLEKWQTWVVGLASLLTIVSLTVDLPEKFGCSMPDSPEKKIEQSVAGTVLDRATGAPLAGVIIFTTEFKSEKGGILADTSDATGGFEIAGIRADVQAPIRLIASRVGYQTYRTDASLGNTKLVFQMEEMR